SAAVAVVEIGKKNCGVTGCGGGGTGDGGRSAIAAASTFPPLAAAGRGYKQTE
ncbi:hypothetical protein Dimus_011464, partial [Dionaea muscipula]